MERSRGLGYLWAGFALTFVAFASYPLLFARFPVTRDIPWANYILFAVAGILLFIGLRRAFSGDSTLRRKMTASMLSLLSVAIFGFFTYFILVAAKQLPPSKGVPRVGEKAPDFSLQDTNGKPISLAELLAMPLPGTPARTPKGVVLIFYRGYW